MTTTPPAPPKKIDPLMVDLYPGDYNGIIPLDQILAWQACVALSLKATEGVTYKPRWFKQWYLEIPRRAHRTFYRQAYHYLRADAPGDMQANFCLQAIDEAGGWSETYDLPLMLDAERGGPKSPNQHATRNQWIDVIQSFAELYHHATGRPLILYGIGVLRDFSIRKTDTRCEMICVARYTETLPASTYVDLGWAYTDLFGWQYCGMPEGGKLPGYPLAIPGTEKLQRYTDLTALQVDPAKAAAMRLPTR